jgi:hypothetical protein
VRPRMHLILAVVAVVLGTVVAPAAAQTQEERTLTVTPNTGLVDGQVVSIRGTGFADMVAVSPLQCPPQFAGRTEFGITEVLANCGFIVFAWDPTIDSAGNLTDSAPVQEVFTPSSGGPVYDCTVRNDCVLLVAGLGGGAPELGGAAVPIRFGPETPATKAACKNGGWRNLANDQGQPFRNQGQCVSYVVARRR